VPCAHLGCAFSAATSPVPAPATAAARPPVAAPDDEISLSSFYSGPSPPPAPRARPATAGDAPSSAGPLEAKGHDALDSPPPAHLGVGSRAASTVSPRSVTSSARAVAAASTPPRAEDSASGTAGPAAFSGGAPSADDGAGVVLKTPGHPEFDVVSWLDSLGLRCYAAQFVSSCCVTPLRLLGGHGCVCALTLGNGYCSTYLHWGPVAVGFPLCITTCAL